MKVSFWKRLFEKDRVKEVENYYREWTPRYQHTFGDTFQSHRPENLQDYFAYLSAQINIQPGMQIADAGCGIGGPLFGLAKLHPDCKFLGLNLSTEQLEVAQKRRTNEAIEHVSFELSNFHHLRQSFSSESFDRIYFLESLVHSDQVERVLVEVHHCLKPYGKIYIKDLFERVALDANDEKKIKRSVEENDRLFCMNIRRKEDLLLMLRKVGFKLDFCKLLEIEANQDVGNKFVVENNIVKDVSQWHPYLEWYEIRATKVMTAFD
jgi:ubiquinone/menaquinone biosynthesis C-methylase UbiE